MAKLTNHAVQRMQQRGIDPATVDYLLAYGDERCTNGGATILYFAKRFKKKLFGHLNKGERVKLEGAFNVYLILGDDDHIVTVGHRISRLSKH